MSPRQTFCLVRKPGFGLSPERPPCSFNRLPMNRILSARKTVDLHAGKVCRKTFLKSFTPRLCVEHSYANMISRVDKHIVMPSMGLGGPREDWAFHLGVAP